MRGRILSIKKSTWLMISLAVNVVIFSGLSIFSMAIWNNFDNAFFFFCLGTGLHQFIKSLLFKYDSSCFFGVLLFLIGFFYFFVNYFMIEMLYPVFIILAVAFSSFTVGLYYNEPFQIFLSLSLFFVSIGLLLFLLNIISVWIFVAITAGFVLLLIIRFLTI